MSQYPIYKTIRWGFSQTCSSIQNISAVSITKVFLFIKQSLSITKVFLSIKQSQKSTAALLDGSRFWGLFGRENHLFYNQINMVVYAHLFLSKFQIKIYDSYRKKIHQRLLTDQIFHLEGTTLETLLVFSG